MPYLFEYNVQHFVPKTPTKTSCALYMSACCTRINTVIFVLDCLSNCNLVKTSLGPDILELYELIVD